MLSYSFQGLSPHDFEILVRDLLQAELGIRFESFTSGADKGIDLRYAETSDGIVVQCKHYPHTDWPALKRALASELDKVTQLEPYRYVVVTSMGLTPDRKKSVLQMFSPYCRSAGDVLGRDDLNNLLGLHPDVEKRHFKLWLTSTSVLTRVLNSGIFSDQQGELESIQRRVSRFVSNPSVVRAIQALSDHKFAVITGVPGIGKTTLAEMLIVEHLSRGFECFRIWEGIAEARAVFQRHERQLFYFDDFLGRTGLRQQIHRNEDERLVRFIREVSRCDNTRLILTTREYILNQARTFMEALRTDDIELGRCVIDLGDYTPRIRAEILYNHLYFSDVPSTHIEAIVASRAYRAIVRHKNYNPRILEAMTDALNLRSVKPTEYPAQFIASLSNPRRIWEVAFQQHLSVEAQNALLVIATMPDRARIEDVQKAFSTFHLSRATRYGFPRTPYDWQRAVKELEGTFIKNELSLGEFLIEFHNPSLRDFVEAHLCETKQDVEDLVEGAEYAYQLERLWRLLQFEQRPGPMAVSLKPLFLRRFWALRTTEAVRLQQIRYYSGVHKWEPVRESGVFRFTRMWDMAGNVTDSLDVLEPAALELASALRGTDKRELVTLLERLIGSTLYEHPAFSDLFEAVLLEAFEFGDFMEIVEFAALTEFDEEYAGFVPAHAKERLVAAFTENVDREEDAIRHESDAETRISWYDDFKSIADKLGVKLGITRSELEDEEEEEHEDDESRWVSSGGGSEANVSDALLDQLFGSLRSSRM